MNNKAFILPNYLKQKKNLINNYLEKILIQCGLKQKLTRAMQYSVMAGGKRLRPTLALASAEAVSKNYIYALPCACAIEMIHTYSLIHDDLPSMDNDDLRRGIPTCHKAFSEAIAILAGDGLLTHAFQVLANPSPFFKKYPEKDILLDIIRLISDAAGVNGMIQGQIMDIDLNLKSSKLDYLKKMHKLKTGKMLVASVHAGALSVNAKQEMIKNLMIYGDKIGLAFQITDDILNVEGNSAIMGKATGSDALNNKITFPGLMGLEQSKKYAKELINDAICSLKNFHGNTLPLQAIAKYILTRNS
ncbi:MAG: farnesyl-diphosphate synthase [Desulfobacteraceae bacterium 4572_130]|nr:MAG: farnesyl-diphosphate synthase [Desulfobacteraceae bacterium 4572_130]